MGADYDVFVSYAHANAIPVHTLVTALRHVGLQVWVDEQRIEDFASITSSITTGLARAKALLAYYSATYPTRRACQWELTAAFVAGQHAGDPRRRILVINPEQGTGHIEPVELRDALFQPAPDADSAVDALAFRIKRHLATLDQPLGDVLSIPGPRWVPSLHTGSTRFVSRTTDLWRLHSALAAPRVGAITGVAGGGIAQIQGLGGIGKTLLAEEYALRFGTAYPGGIFWLRAFGHDDRTLGLGPEAVLAAHDTDVRAAVAELGLPVADLTAAEVRATLAGWLAQQGKRCLWVVDDVPGTLTVEQVQRLLAPHPLAATLLTTRSHAYDTLISQVTLDVLPEDDAYTLLTSRRAPAAPAEKEAARALVRVLGGHALALEVTGAVMVQQAGILNYAEMQDLLAKPTGDELEALVADLGEALPTGHEHSIAKTLSRSLDQLGPDGWDVIRVAALVAAAPVPVGLVTEILQTAQHRHGSAADEEPGEAARRATRGLGQAAGLSLASQVDPERGTWQVHALVARTARFADPDPARTALLRTAAVQVLISELAAITDPRTHRQLAELVVHARELTGTIHTEDEVILLGWVGQYDLERGQYAAAKTSFHRQWEACRRLLGEGHPDTLEAMVNLSHVLRELGDLDGAQPLQEQVLAARQQALGENHPDTLAAMEKLAWTLRDRGDLAGAQPLQEQVLTGRRRKLSDDHPHVLIAMAHLAVTLRNRGDPFGAKELEEQVVQASRRVLGDDHPETLRAMGNLSTTLKACGDLAGAQALGEQVLAARRQVLGDDHPNTLTAMGNLALSLMDRGDLASAQPLQEQVLAGRRRVLGDDHPETLMAMTDLASTLWARGDLPGAQGLQEAILAARRRALGDDHPITLTLMGNLALILRDRGDLDGAQPLQQQVLAGCRRVLGDDHPDTLTAMGNLAVILRDRGDLAPAQALGEQVLAGRRRVLGDDHPETLMAMTDLASTLWARGDLPGAQGLQEAILAARRRHQAGDDHPDTLTLMGNLAVILRDRGDLDGAQPLQQQVLAGCRRVLGDDHPETLMAMTDLASTLWARGDLPGAQELEEQVLRASRRVLGDDHPDTLTAMGNLAVTLRGRKNLTRAQALLEQVLASSRRVLGDDHPSTLAAMEHLALTLKARGDLTSAQDLQEQALAASRRVLGDEHPDTLTAMDNLSTILLLRGNTLGAQSQCERALEARQRILGNDHPDTLTSMTNLVRILRAFGDLPRAQALYEQAKGISEQRAKDARSSGPSA